MEVVSERHMYWMLVFCYDNELEAEEENSQLTNGEGEHHVDDNYVKSNRSV